MKNRIPIIAAVILGIFVIFAIQNYVKRAEEAANRQLEGNPVVSARAAINAGEEITENMLTPINVPNQFIPRQAVTPQDWRLLLGRQTRVPIAEGQIILWSDLEVEKRGGLSSLIPEGERGYTVDISAGVNSALLQLNDRVDIIGIFQEPEGGSVGPVGPAAAAAAAVQDQTVCVVLLQNVNIIAIGETIGEVYRLAEEGSAGAVTFSVTLPEAQLLMYASQHGELALVLRREGETEILARADLPRITMESLEDITGELDQARARRTIQVVTGSGAEEIQIETDSGLDYFE